MRYYVCLRDLSKNILVWLVLLPSNKTVFVIDVLACEQAREQCQALTKRCEEYAFQTAALQKANYEMSQVSQCVCVSAFIKLCFCNYRILAALSASVVVQLLL